MKKVATKAQQVLLDELNEFYISLNGEGISRHYTNILLEGGIETIQALIEEQKMLFAGEISPEDKELQEQIRMEELFMRDMDNFESERCDSIEHN